MLPNSQKSNNTTLPGGISFQSLLINLGRFFNENLKQILTIFILLLLAGQAGAILNPVARRQDFSRNNDCNLDSDVCVDGECISDADAITDFAPSNNNEVCIADEMPVVPLLTCVAKPKTTSPDAPICPKVSYLKENVQHALMGWEKVGQYFSKNIMVAPGARDYYAKHEGAFENDMQILFALLKEVYFSAVSIRCTI